MRAVAETTGTAEVIAEAEKFKNIHEQKIAEENSKNLSQNAKDYNREDAEHDRKDNIIEFERGKITLKIGKNKYIADVVIGVKDNGGKSFAILQILKIKKAPNRATKKRTPEKGGLIDVLSSNNIISPIDGKSNPPSIGNNVFGAGKFKNVHRERAAGSLDNDRKGTAVEDFFGEKRNHRYRI